MSQQRVAAVIQGVALILGILALGTTFGLAYYGAFTDSIHAWQACSVSLALTVVCGFIFASTDSR